MDKIGTSTKYHGLVTARCGGQKNRLSNLKRWGWSSPEKNTMCIANTNVHKIPPNAP